MRSSAELTAEGFGDATLILIGHGSTVNGDSTATVRQHATALRSRGLFADVQEAFWKVEPRVAGALERAATRRVFVVPFFVSEGWFTEEAVPAELGLKTTDASTFERNQVVSGKHVSYTKPPGTHPRMTEVILARARGVVERHPFPRIPKLADVALVVVGHGTERNDNSRRAVERQVELIRERGGYRSVHAAYMMEEPKLAQIYDATDARAIVVVPFFMSDGLHVTEDIPVLLGEPERLVKERLTRGVPTWRNPTERRGRRVWYSASVGSEAVLSDVILDRVRESARGT